MIEAVTHELKDLFFRLTFRPAGENHRHGITEFHHVVHQHLDIIGSGDFELDLAKNHYTGRGQRRVV